MSTPTNDKVFIFAGRATETLAREVAINYGTDLGKSAIFQYADGEFQPSFEQSIRGGIVFIIQSTMPPTDNLFELLMMVDAAKRASAHKIIAVIPYYGFARQDRKDKPHVPIASKLIANMLQAAGVDRVVTMDLHADQIQGFFDIPVDHLFGSSLFMPYIRDWDIPVEDIMFASPDMGGSKRAGVYAKTLNNSFVVCYKHRNKPNEIGEMRLIGDVAGKHVILLDDIIVTPIYFLHVFIRHERRLRCHANVPADMHLTTYFQLHSFMFSTMETPWDLGMTLPKSGICRPSRIKYRFWGLHITRDGTSASAFFRPSSFMRSISA